MLYYVLGSPPPLWGQGDRGQAWSKGSKLGARGGDESKREQAGRKREQGEQEGTSWEQEGARGASWEQEGARGVRQMLY